MAAPKLSIDTTYPMNSGFEIPVLGYGVSLLYPISFLGMSILLVCLLIWPSLYIPEDRCRSWFATPSQCTDRRSLVPLPAQNVEVGRDGRRLVGAIVVRPEISARMGARPSAVASPTIAERPRKEHQ